MASYKSHYNPPKRIEEETPSSYHISATRLPQRSVTPTTITSQIPTSSSWKLQKRRPSKDEQAHPSRGVWSKAKVALGSPQSSVTKPTTHTSSHIMASKSSQSSSSRLPKLEVPQSTRTPSLVSGSSASTVDSPRSNVLRRKQSSIGTGVTRQESRRRDDSMSSHEDRHAIAGIPGGYKDPFSETVLGISLPPTSTILARSDPDVQIGHDLSYDIEVEPTEILPPPIPQYALSSTPSTHYSESPGPFSVSSTPTSMSSYSPGVTFTVKSTTRARQVSPLQAKPLISRHREEEGSSTRDPKSSAPTSRTLVQRQPSVLKKELPKATRRPSQPTAEQPKVQAPPELAHLVDLPSSTVAARRPTRPSRDGTPEILGIQGPSPIIQSNMTSFPSHKRTMSNSSAAGPVMSSKTKFGMQSKPSSRNPSPNPSLASGFIPSRVPTRGTTSDVQSDSDKQRSQTFPPSAETTGSTKTSRFGFFSRRTKTDPAAKSDKKLHRRGPAAGTGHEGYGRYAAGGRNGSTASGSSIGRSASAATTSESLDRPPSTRKSSMTSTTSTDVDDYFLERLTPVIIRGTGSSAELTRSPEPMHSTSSLDIPGTLVQSPDRMSEKDSKGSRRPVLLPSAMSDPVRGLSPVKKPQTTRRPSESDGESKKSFIPSLTSRRTSRMSKVVNPTPPAERIANKTRKDSIGEANVDGSRLKPSKKEKSDKDTAKPPRKWNFFQRAHANPRAPTPAAEVTTTSPARAPASRSVAHYALLDAPSGLNIEDIEMIMKEADNTPDEVSADERDNVGSETEHGRRERLQSMLLPPKPILPDNIAPPSRPASPKVFLRPGFQPKLTLDTSTQEKAQPAPLSVADLTPVTDLSPCSSPISPEAPPIASDPPVVTNTAGSPSRAPSPAVLPLSPPTLSPPGPPPQTLPPRPSRLAQVGRIPQVVSRRNQVHRPPSRSFSRPFVADQPRPSLPAHTSFDSASGLIATASSNESYPILRGLDALTHSTAIATLSPSGEEAARQSEFFKFPPRKDSEVSYSSSSGAWSFPPTADTAVVPAHGAPRSDDEIWKEYDDLIDEVLSPADSQPMDSQVAMLRNHPSLEPLPLRTKHSRASSQSVASAGVSNPSLHLRRSRLLAVLHSQSPTSSISLSEFLREYGERNLSVVDPVTGRLSFPSTARMSTGSGPRNRPVSNRTSLPASLSLSTRHSKATLASTSDKDRNSTNTNKYRDTRLMEIAETQAEGLSAMANLRFGALMTSKWLSFGRVIFSPAHFELRDASQDRVLVIDGLGKDWSYYCALTYPEATVYNLGPGPSSSEPNGSGGEPWSTLNNHRHFNHPSLGHPFPFPKGFFACVVLRFPPALTTGVHGTLLSECKRVLRPGGFLELSVLDLDLVNMGNRARRAVRGLKVKMQVADEHISLRNASDEYMNMVGRKGFTDCNRCFVGVPVAGLLPGAEDGDAEGRTRKGSTASTTDQARAARPPRADVSFSDLLSTRNSSESTDNTIADMVARVGRWWYSRCYEALVLPEAGEAEAANSGKLLQSSIWRDDSLINECERRGTSFRLLIGYAQKPEVGVRRTVSV